VDFTVDWELLRAEESGSYSVTWANAHAKNSSKVDDLDAGFRTKVKEFIAALEAAGATVNATATKRSDKRAYLFHWSWKIHLDKCPRPARTRRPSRAITSRARRST